MQWKSFKRPPKEGEKILALTHDKRTIRIHTFDDWRSFSSDYLGWMPAGEVIDAPVGYDPSFGDDKLCKCGHRYYRHFDTYEDMYPIGCKYCHGLGETRKESPEPEGYVAPSSDDETGAWAYAKHISCCNGFELDPNPNNTGCHRCDQIEGCKECLCPPRNTQPELSQGAS
jgi:hypothetical protein